MKVTTNMSRIDLVRFNLSIIPRMKSTYITGLVFAAFIFAFLFWSDGIPCSTNEWLKYVFVSFCGGFGAILGGSIFSIIGIVLSADTKNGILGEHHYEILENGLLEKTDANESIVKWGGILEITETQKYLLIRISSYLFHVIPKRSFSSEAEYKTFLELTLSHWRNAHGK